MAEYEIPVLYFEPHDGNMARRIGGIKTVICPTSWESEDQEQYIEDMKMAVKEQFAEEEDEEIERIEIENEGLVMVSFGPREMPTKNLPALAFFRKKYQNTYLNDVTANVCNTVVVIGTSEKYFQMLAVKFTDFATEFWNLHRDQHWPRTFAFKRIQNPHSSEAWGFHVTEIPDHRPDWLKIEILDHDALYVRIRNDGRGSSDAREDVATFLHKYIGYDLDRLSKEKPLMWEYLRNADPDLMFMKFDQSDNISVIPTALYMLLESIQNEPSMFLSGRLLCTKCKSISEADRHRVSSRGLLWNGDRPFVKNSHLTFLTVPFLGSGVMIPGVRL